jgi:hypothetical protein
MHKITNSKWFIKKYYERSDQILRLSLKDKAMAAVAMLNPVIRLLILRPNPALVSLIFQ